MHACNLPISYLEKELLLFDSKYPNITGVCSFSIGKHYIWYLVMQKIVSGCRWKNIPKLRKFLANNLQTSSGVNKLVKKSSSLISLVQFLGNIHYYEDKITLVMSDAINVGLFLEQSYSLIKTVHVSAIIL